MQTMKLAGPKIPVEFVVPLNMNGMRGRMVHLPTANSNRRREILFIYGQRSSLECWWGLLHFLSRYGSVTAPDLPGFGGMASFKTVGRKPSLDNLADYLAAFIRLRYRRKRLTIIGYGFGFVVATRTLERYPELAKKVDLVISLGGVTHFDDYALSRPQLLKLRIKARLLSIRSLAWVFRAIWLHRFVLKRTSHFSHNSEALKLEVVLWRINDTVTYMKTEYESLHLDNCKLRIKTPAWHVQTKTSKPVDQHRVEQHLRIIFDKLRVIKAIGHTKELPLVLNDKRAAELIPTPLRRVLSRKP